MRLSLSLLITLCLAQTSSHPVSVSWETLQTIQDELTSLESDTASNLEHTLQSINELKRLLVRIRESHVAPETEDIDEVVEQETAVETSEDTTWRENDEEEREEEIITAHERWESEEVDSAAMGEVGNPADVLQELDDLINDASEQEESFDPVSEKREEEYEEEVNYEESEDQMDMNYEIFQEDTAMQRGETVQVVEPQPEQQPEPEPEPVQEEADPRQAEEDAAEAYLKELGFD